MRNEPLPVKLRRDKLAGQTCESQNELETRGMDTGIYGGVYRCCDFSCTVHLTVASMKRLIFQNKPLF